VTTTTTPRSDAAALLDSLHGARGTRSRSDAPAKNDGVGGGSDDDGFGCGDVAVGIGAAEQSGMDILTLIRRDHDDFFARVMALEEILDWQRGYLQRPVVTHMVHELVKALQVHARAEELSLYKALLELDLHQLDEKSREGVAEHSGIDDACKRLVDLCDDFSAGREDILAEVVVLKELLEHHAHHEEEEELFPEIKQRFDSDARKALGAEMESLRLALQKAPEKLREEAVVAG
jgi:hypothetical protein